MRISASPPCTIFVVKFADGDEAGRADDCDAGKSGVGTISRECVVSLRSKGMGLLAR